MAWSPLYFFVAIAGWVVPIVLIFVTVMAGAIFVGAAISVLDGLFDGGSGHTAAPTGQGTV
ncbi:MAG: hypothetical protein FJZ01_16770 [Candidatus Sericytochromatia bacterium]|nr:hypothetical protein [Candidatus Tanganyikabacteria bacterium]